MLKLTRFPKPGFRSLSANEAFVTLDTPQCGGRFRTVLYLATKNGGTDEDSCLSNTWQCFAGPANVCAWDESSKSYTRPLYYYQDENGGDVITAAGLLAYGNGQCHAWADLFKECLRANKVQNVRRTEVDPPAGPPECDMFGVKNISFAENPRFPQDALWKYSQENLDTTIAGLPGQNMETPQLKLFEKHWLVHRTGDETYYDPSYGVVTTGPAAYTEAAVAAFRQASDGHWSNRADVPELELRFSDSQW